MAVTTVHEPLRHIDTNVYTFFGYRVPENVTYVEVVHDIYGDYVIRWISGPNKTKHSMDMPIVTDETIMAVLAAMRLSC